MSGMTCESCGTDPRDWRHRRGCPPPAFDVNAPFAGLVLLIDSLTANRNQHGRCGLTYSETSCHPQARPRTIDT